MPLNRRTLLKLSGAASLGCLLQPASLFAAQPVNRRRFHLCLSPDALERDPALLPTIRQAGVDAVWLGGFFYGHWPLALEKLRLAPDLERVPHVEESELVVCAWYPTARAVLLWNVDEQAKRLTLKHGRLRRRVTVAALGTSLVEPVG